MSATLADAFGLLPSTLADWVAAGAAILALVGTVIALVQSGKANKHAKNSLETANSANGIATEANTLATGANSLASGANTLATEANALAGEANTISDRVFAADVRVREQSQARLVYAAIEQDPMLWRKDREVERLPVPLDWSSLVDIEIPFDQLFEFRDPPYERIWAVQELTVIDVSVHNLSDEVIADALVELFHPDQTDRVEVGVHTRAILPHTHVTAQFVLKGARSGYQPQLTFLDSGGKWWTRRGFEPMFETPKELHPTPPENPRDMGMYRSIETEERKP